MSTSPTDAPYHVFAVENFGLDCGQTLKSARLAYYVRGELGNRSPILTCTAFSQTYDDLAYLRNADGPLAQIKRPIIHTELLGNGRSSSPKGQSESLGPSFPPITIRDNVRLQKALLDHLGVARIFAVIGASMGGQQALQWAVSYPEMVERAVVMVGSAQATLHAQLFLNSLAEAIRSDPVYRGGNYTLPPYTGLARMSEIWAAWAMSPEFFSSGAYQSYDDTNAGSLDEFLSKWRTRYFQKDANNLLSHLEMWSAHDVATTPGCDNSLAVALGRIRAEVLFLPCRTDAYFAVSDVQREAALIKHSDVVVIDSISGHAAGFGRSEDDQRQIKAALSRFLAV